MAKKILFILATLVLVPGFARGQTPLGPEFRVDLPGAAPYVRYPPALTFLRDGTLWITWESHPLGGAYPYGVVARSYTPTGEALRPVLVLPGLVEAPLLTRSAQDELAVFGRFEFGPTGGPAFVVRRLSPAGVPRRHPVYIQQAGMTSFIRHAAVALPNGGFFFAWQEDDCPGRCRSEGVSGRVLDREGRPVTPAFRVSESFRGYQSPDALVVDPEGRVTVIWSGEVAPKEYAIFARRFTQEGKPLTGEFRLSGDTPGFQASAATAADGSFIATWTYQDIEGFARAIHARRFSREGVPLGPEIQVNQEVAFLQVSSQVALSPTGDAFVVWTSFRCAECDSVDVKGRLLHADGSAEDEILVNQERLGIQNHPAVAFSAQGRVAVAWTAEVPSLGDLVVMARFYTVE